MTNDANSFEFYSTVKEKSVEWLWYPFIPYGKITLLQGDPGEGKSTFIINVIAALSTGRELPNGALPETPIVAVYQCAEDSLQDTIKPRLLQAGADCSRVAFILDGDQSLSLDDERIERCIQETGARLFVLDPLQAYIKQDGDFQSATRMRSLMRRLSSVAERNQCAIVLVGHLNKSSGGKNLYRGLGSIDIAAIARSVLMITRDETTQEIRYMFPIKSSLAPESYGMSFVLDPETGFHWIGKCHYDRAQLAVSGISALSKKERAKQLLKLMLSSEDLKSTEALMRLTWLGISERTVRNAEKELGVEAYRKRNVWYLRLPETSKQTVEENDDE